MTTARRNCKYGCLPVDERSVIPPGRSSCDGGYVHSTGLCKCINGLIKMKLSKENLKIFNRNRAFPFRHGKIVELPEKVLQFGTGVFASGLPDYFIDKGNHKEFYGRVVVVNLLLPAAPTLSRSRMVCILYTFVE